MARLRMTNADYVAIAVSPALIMALIGSLVFFLIEVLYVGQYQLRLNYVFALFVFATVLIGRISIEMGSERAALFSLPLGVVTFLALVRFVEHPTSYSWLINLALLAIVWWCAHKLTWDCTLIDDNEDASGEGLLDRMGPADNELFAHSEPSGESKPPWWRRINPGKKGPHSPGLWVLYFSLAALPLFGIGQRCIPSSDVGRRRYAFALLAIYVFAGLSLLVTTSFLGLRRYLRQRNVEMPAPMAATWVSLGGVLILLVMFVAALIPRPSAEYAISQVPWQARSPDGLSSSRVSVGDDGADEGDPENGVVTEDEEAPAGSAVDDQQHAESSSQSSEERRGQQSDAQQEGGQGKSKRSEDGESSNESGQPAKSQEPADASEPASDQAAAESPSESSPRQEDAAPDESKGGETSSQNESPQASDESTDNPSSGIESSGSFERPNPAALLQGLSSSLGNMLKWAFYALGALLIAYLVWRNREKIIQTIGEIIREFRELLARLFGRDKTAAAAGDDGSVAARPRRRTFADFSDPFASDRHRQVPPVELVRYTFEAFEAWAGDRGAPRTPDCTPHELVQLALAPQTPMYDEARRMVRFYSEAAYASGTISRDAAGSLRPLWQMMRSSQSPSRSAGSAATEEAAGRL